MGKERRYSEKEINAIFRQASKEQASWKRNRSLGEGLSLSELQEIGEESGITPEFIARAAASLDRSGAPVSSETLLGFPLVVSKTVTLPGKLTEEEWEQLIVDLRRTYQREGTITQEGSFRKWTQGELSVMVEPTDAGHQVRMTTAPQKRGATKFILGLGLALSLISLFFWVQVLFMGRVEWSVITPGTVFLLSGLLPVIPLFLTPRWAKKHKDKMDSVALRLKDRLGLFEKTAFKSANIKLEGELYIESAAKLELENLANEGSQQTSVEKRSGLRN